MVIDNSIRKQVYFLWVQNPHFKAKLICQKLKLDYKNHGQYVNNLLSSFRSHNNFGFAQKPLPHRRIFVWNDILRELLPEKKLEKLGWKLSNNRNGMLIFSGDQGTVHWYKNGKVRLYLRGAVQIARAKELFCRAFHWFTTSLVCRYVDAPLREVGRHWVFEVGCEVPRFDIHSFKSSHGIRVFSDGSHPRAVEIEETQPFWLRQFEKITAKLEREIDSHLDLLYKWKEEADKRVIEKKECLSLSLGEQPSIAT